MSDDLGATVPGYITKMCFSAKYEFICPWFVLHISMKSVNEMGEKGSEDWVLFDALFVETCFAIRLANLQEKLIQCLQNLQKAIE